MDDSQGSARTRAKNRYNAKAYDHIHIVVKKGRRNIIKEFAASCGKSLNAFVTQAIIEKMERDCNILQI